MKCMHRSGMHGATSATAQSRLLYRIVEDNYPAFVAQMAREGRPLPYYVQREFDEFLCCGRLEHGFLRVRCDDCHTGAAGRLQVASAGVFAPEALRRQVESSLHTEDPARPPRPPRQDRLPRAAAVRRLLPARRLRRR